MQVLRCAWPAHPIVLLRCVGPTAPPLFSRAGRCRHASLIRTRTCQQLPERRPVTLCMRKPVAREYSRRTSWTGPMSNVFSAALPKSTARCRSLLGSIRLQQCSAAQPSAAQRSAVQWCTHSVRAGTHAPEGKAAVRAGAAARDGDGPLLAPRCPTQCSAVQCSAVHSGFDSHGAAWHACVEPVGMAGRESGAEGAACRARN